MEHRVCLIRPSRITSAYISAPRLTDPTGTPFMIRALPPFLTLLLTLAAAFISFPIQAQVQATEIGVVVMHGKGGNPGKFVDGLARALEQEGFRVANLEMPWSGARQYDVDMNRAANEITAALDAMRAKGA